MQRSRTFWEIQWGSPLSDRANSKLKITLSDARSRFPLMEFPTADKVRKPLREMTCGRCTMFEWLNTSNQSRGYRLFSRVEAVRKYWKTSSFYLITVSIILTVLSLILSETPGTFPAPHHGNLSLSFRSYLMCSKAFK